MARWSDKGKACAELSPLNGERLEMAYIMHAALYLVSEPSQCCTPIVHRVHLSHDLLLGTTNHQVYVGSMLSITYFSFLKATFFSKDKVGGTPAGGKINAAE